MTLLRNALIGLGLALAIPAMSAAAPPAEDPRDVRIRELSDRVSDLEKAIKDLNAQVESAARNADLARGDIKVLQDRMAGSQPTSPAPVPVVAGPATAATAAAAPGSPAAPAGDGLTLGRQQLQGGDARTAEATLTTWLASAPGDPKAGEGAYLRGRARSTRMRKFQVPVRSPRGVYDAVAKTDLGQGSRRVTQRLARRGGPARALSTQEKSGWLGWRKPRGRASSPSGVDPRAQPDRARRRAGSPP